MLSVNTTLLRRNTILLYVNWYVEFDNVRYFPLSIYNFITLNYAHIFPTKRPVI